MTKKEEEKKVFDRDFFVEAGRRGGNATKAKMGLNWYKDELSKMGAKARWKHKVDKKEVKKNE